jgi:hypothetical protein
MSNTDMTLFDGGQVPDYLKKGFESPQDTVDELSSGVVTGFPVLSFRGKVWRLKKGGEESAFVDENGDPRPSIELILVKGSPRLSKIFYATGYEEGSTEAPTCFSMDGTRPDPSVMEKQSDLCATCPKNQWGSKITPQGTKTKLCADARRLAVVGANDLNANLSTPDNATPILLRIPGASLASLKEYAERALGARGYNYFAVVTRIGFDTTTSYPKLTFRPVRVLTEQEYHAVTHLRAKSDSIARVLNDHGDLIEGTPSEEEAHDAEPIPELPKAEPAKATKPKAATKPKEAPKQESPQPSNAKLDSLKSDVDALLGSL